MFDEINFPSFFPHSIWVVTLIAAVVFSLWLLSYFFYFRKHYTETCGCGLCAEEKPMSHSNQVGYGSLQGGGSQEMNGVHVEKEEESK